MLIQLMVPPEVGVPALTPSVVYLPANATSAVLTVTGANFTTAITSIKVYFYDSAGNWIDWLVASLISSSATELSLSISSSVLSVYVWPKWQVLLWLWLY